MALKGPVKLFLTDRLKQSSHYIGTIIEYSFYILFIKLEFASKTAYWLILMSMKIQN